MINSQVQSTETESLLGRPPQPQPENKSPPPGISAAAGYGSIQTNIPQSYTWREDLRRNRPQLRSLSAASLIFMSGGMSLSLSVGFAPAEVFGTHFQYCWFIAIIIGACFSACLAHKVQKRMFYLVGSILVIINGIINVVEKQNGNAIIYARYCDGIAFGLVIIPTILAGSEQSFKRFRAHVLSCEHTGLITGAMLRAAFTRDNYVQANTVQGILAIIFGLLALILNFVFTLESPIFHLRNNNETEAVEAVRKLQSPRTDDNETDLILNENRAMLEEDRARGGFKNITISLIPLIKMSLFRVLVSLSFSLPLTLAYSLAYGFNNNGSNPDWYIYVLLRFLGVIFSTVVQNNCGRRITSAVLFLISSGFLIGVASIFSTFSSPLDPFFQGNMKAAIILMLFYQLLTGLVAPTSTCYLGEAFSVSVKPFFILAIIIVENVVQIIVTLSLNFESLSNFVYALAAMQVIFGCAIFFIMPETFNTTLREALDKFNKICSVIIGQV